MRASCSTLSRWLVPGGVLLALVGTTPRVEACGACAIPELWDVQNLGGELTIVTNFGLLAEHGDGWRVTCEERFGGLLLSARGDGSVGWVSTDVGQFRTVGSLCDWTPGAPLAHASWAWRFALAHAEGASTRFVLVIDSDTQELHVERARADEDFRVVHSFESTSGIRDLQAAGDPASVFAAGFGAGADRLWQVAYSLDAGDHWETAVPELPSDTNWVLSFVDPEFPAAVLVESKPVSERADGLWRFDAKSGSMIELLSLAEGEGLAGITVLGDTLWVAARGDTDGSLYHADRRELAFSRVVTDAPPFACLAAHGGALYACVNDFSYTSSFLIGRSHDEGRSWQPVLTVDDLGHVAGCGPECGRTLDWLSAAFGVPGAAGASADAGGAVGASASTEGEAGAGSVPVPPATASGCSCRLGASRQSGGVALVLGLWLSAVRLRRPRGSRRVSRHVAFPALFVPLVLASCSAGESASEPEPEAADCGGRGDDLATLHLASGELELRVLEVSPAPPGVGDNEWLVRVSYQAGEVATGLAESLVVTAFMPDHGHGTPALVGVTETEAGEYRLAPVNTFMPGLWQIRMAVNRTQDPVLFEFSVCVE